MIAGFYGFDVDMAKLRRALTPSTRGVSLASIIKAADRLDLVSRAVRAEPEDLAHLSLPAILHWDLSHYVVVEQVSQGRALIHDPASASQWLNLDEVSKHFTGIALELQPSPAFQPRDIRQRLRLSNLWSHLGGFKRAASQAIVLSAVVQLFTLVAPYYLQFAVDNALPDANSSLLTSLAFGFVLFSILAGFAGLIRASVLLAAGSTLGAGLSSNVARKLFRLPVEWFSRRQIGDILSRFQSVIPIRKMLAEDAPVTFVDGLLAIASLVLMMLYSPKLSLISVAGLATVIAIRLILFESQRSAQEAAIVASGREQSVLIESLRGIRVLRLAGAELTRLALWQSRMNEAVNANIRLQRIANWQLAIQTMIFAIENIIIICIGIRGVINESYTLGMFVAFMAYKAQFLITSTSLISKVFEFRMLDLHLERLSDIALADSDEPARARTTDRGPVELNGQVELRNIFFRYDAEGDWVLKNVSLHVPTGSSIAITGPSGGGKSTLAQIILGLADPASGEVLVDGRALQKFGLRNYQSQIAAVMQDDSLFGGSIADNIALFYDAPNVDRVKECARIAAIDQDIESMPMGYETLVGEMGTSLSGGQRQRLFLARALYRRPRILVLDEGTSNLDDEREKAINDALEAMEITRIVIAHRRQTIERAERAYSLQHGELCDFVV